MSSEKEGNTFQINICQFYLPIEWTQEAAVHKIN